MEMNRERERERRMGVEKEETHEKSVSVKSFKSLKFLLLFFCPG